jgi:hypothetical protein
MADPERNADRLGRLREDVDQLRGTLRTEIRTAKRTAVTWGVRLLMAHLAVGGTILSGLVLALLT